MTGRLPTIPDVARAVDEANRGGLLDHVRQADASRVLSGLSGRKLIGVLQRLGRLFADVPDACYLEVGVFQGLTLNSVACAVPRLPCFGIDNFAFFDPDKRNLAIVNERIETLGNCNAVLINADYEDALEGLERWLRERKVAVYFVDGPHDYRSQLLCLQLALPHLHERAVIVIDDANYEHVRQANADFLRLHADWRLVAEAYTPAHPENMDPAGRAEAIAGWWNGMNVLCRAPESTTGRVYPPTRRERSAFETDHLVHPHRMAPLVLECLDLGNAIARGRPLAVARRLVGIARRTRALSGRLGRFDTMNTDSDVLPSFRLIDDAA